MRILGFTKLSQVLSSNLLKSSLIYIVCDGINKAIPFLLLPFLTYYLTPSDYGLVTNFNVLVQILSVFCYVSTAGALPVMFYKLDKESFKNYTSNMFYLNTYVTIGCLILLMVFNGLIFKLIEIDLFFQILSLIIVWFASITNINLILWRCEEKPMKFGVFQVTITVINTLSTILFVIILLLGWKGRIYSMLITIIVFGIISFIYLYKRRFIVYKQSYKQIKGILIYAIPLLPHALSFWIKTGVDKILITDMCGLVYNGLYSVAVTWGAIITMFASSFSNAYSPYLYKKLALFDKNNTNSLVEQIRLVKTIYLIIGLFFVFVVLGYLFSVFFIRYIYEPSYYQSLAYLPYVMIGQFFNCCYLMFVCFFHYTFRTKLLGTITFSLSLLQIVFSYIFIKYYGAIGAAISSAIIMFLIALFVIIFGMKIYKLPWFGIKGVKKI